MTFSLAIAANGTRITGKLTTPQLVGAIKAVSLPASEYKVFAYDSDGFCVAADRADVWLARATAPATKEPKLSSTQEGLLAELDRNRLTLNEACRRYHDNIRIPSGCTVVPHIHACGNREMAAALRLVERGLLLRISSNGFTLPWKPTPDPII
jgi:hypothetical protein